MSVQARFYIPSVTLSGSEDERQGVVTMMPTTRGPENKGWAKYTPAGKIEMTVNGPAMDWFVSRIQKDIAITFEDRPLICPKCKGELPGDHYAPSTEPVPGGDGSQWQHKVCPE